MDEFKFSKKIWPTVRIALRACTTALILTLVIPLAGCTSNPAGREPVTRTIPGPPSYLQPVAVPPARAGVSPFIVSEQRKQALGTANTIIAGARGAWSKMKDTYSKSFLKRNPFGR